MGALGLSGLIATIATSGDAPARILRTGRRHDAARRRRRADGLRRVEARQVARFLARCPAADRPADAALDVATLEEPGREHRDGREVGDHERDAAACRQDATRRAARARSRAPVTPPTSGTNAASAARYSASNGSTHEPTSAIRVSVREPIPSPIWPSRPGCQACAEAISTAIPFAVAANTTEASSESAATTSTAPARSTHATTGWSRPPVAGEAGDHRRPAKTIARTRS